MAIAQTFRGCRFALFLVLASGACGNATQAGDDTSGNEGGQAGLNGGSGGKSESGGSGPASGSGGNNGGQPGGTPGSGGSAGTTASGGMQGAAGSGGAGAGGQSNGSGGSMGQPAPSGCGVAADQDTVALWSFESTNADHTGTYPITWRGGTPGTATGADKCAKAIQMDGKTFGEVNFKTGFAGLTEGAIEMFVWLPPKSNKVHVMLAADARNQKSNGHFVLGYETQGKIVLRMQNAETAPEGSKTFYVCSGANMPANQWIHLGINFGPQGVQMFVNGEIAENKGVHYKHGNEQNCGDNPAWSPAGNGNPLVIGGATNEATEGIADTVIKRFEGRIDQLRISRKRRDFAALKGKP
ncbi:MAG: LamG-like jellyroll fold domain-containing protein [Deltaproteobacteria bacterium]|nr:LamG-like jellyroll fold domain-containing protein [Deltaproteobacteria bacterium]